MELARRARVGLGSVVLVVLPLFALSNVWYPLVPMQERALRAVLALVAFHSLTKPKTPRLLGVDILNIGLSVLSFGYVVIEWRDLLLRQDIPTTTDLVFGCVSMYLILFATVRGLGLQFSNFFRAGHLDTLTVDSGLDLLAQWRDSGVACVHITVAVWADARATLDTIARRYRVFRAHGDRLVAALSGDDVRAAKVAGLVPIAGVLPEPDGRLAGSWVRSRRGRRHHGRQLALAPRRGAGPSGGKRVSDGQNQ